jgi:hypothetical protein
MEIFRLLPKKNLFVQIKRKIAALTPFPISLGTKTAYSASAPKTKGFRNELLGSALLNRNLPSLTTEGQRNPDKERGRVLSYPLGD